MSQSISVEFMRGDMPVSYRRAFVLVQKQRESGPEFGELAGERAARAANHSASERELEDGPTAVPDWVQGHDAIAPCVNAARAGRSRRR
jgi:hypothetical protein